MNILSHSCRSALDYRLFEKRFIFRQLLSIYDSKLSDQDTKISILNIILKTADCKYALIDLIRRQYLLVWLASVLENNSVRLLSNEMKVNFFQKFIELYVLIWKQLGKASKSIKDGEETEYKPPNTFLNQMYIIMQALNRIILLNYKKISDLITQDYTTESAQNGEESKISKTRLDLKEYFKCNRELIEAVGDYNSALVRFENENNLDKCILDLQNENEVKFESIIDLIHGKKTFLKRRNLE